MEDTRKYVAVLLLLIASAPLASAQQTAVLNKPLPDGVREILNVPYVAVGHERQKLDIYLPVVPDEYPRPVIVRIHGGAWRHGDKSAQRSVANYVKRGYIGVAINYRFSQYAIFPAQIEDCKAAIRWLKAHSKEYGIDPDRIAVMGSSAGGHLAALLGTTGDTKQFDVGENLEFSSAICAAVDSFGPTDLVQAMQTPGYERKLSAVTQLLGGPVDQREEQATRANPINYISANDPPFLILHGDSDPLVPLNQSRLLYAALREAGILSEFHVVKGGQHGGAAFKTPHFNAIVSKFLEQNVMESPRPR